MKFSTAAKGNHHVFQFDAKRPNIPVFHLSIIPMVSEAN
jgi:hypothetical protein